MPSLLDMPNFRCHKPDFYRDKIVLAPMVRENNLPFRFLCLEYGADLVYTEELIDHKLCECRRLTNKVLGTIDFVDEQGELVLRTDPIEKDKLILQLGSNNADRAIKAARLVEQDVAGIDFNFGCPKSFSLRGGMGAAMLEKPDEVKILLTKCIETLDLPVTCKIRILPNLNKTLELVKLIEACGVSTLAVHGRTKDQRPQHDNQDEVLKQIAKVIDIPMIANGGSNDIRSYSDICNFKERTGASSVMIARCAMKNPSIFKRDNTLEPAEKLAKVYIKLSIRYDNLISLTKYTLQAILSQGQFTSEFLRKFHLAPDYMTLCELFNMSEWYSENKIQSTKADYYDEQPEDENLAAIIAIKMESLKSCDDIVNEFVIDSLHYDKRIFGAQSPKGLLTNCLNGLVAKFGDNAAERPRKEIIQLDRAKKSQFVCTIIYDKVFYVNKSRTNKKKNAEHSTAMLVCQRLGLIDLDDYRARIKACSRSVA